MYLPKQLIIEGIKNANGELVKPIPNITEKIVALGIQGKPGTKFYLNGHSTGNGILSIGKTGIYEIDLTNGFGLITSVDFVEDTLPTEESGEKIIVDYLYITNETEVFNL